MPRKKKMGRPLEDVPLRTLLKSIREDIHAKLEKPERKNSEDAPRKPKRK